jgi:hypothetical protein
MSSQPGNYKKAKNFLATGKIMNIFNEVVISAVSIKNNRLDLCQNIRPIKAKRMNRSAIP